MVDPLFSNFSRSQAISTDLHYFAGREHAKIYLLCDFQSKQTSFSDFEKLEIAKSMGWPGAKTRQLRTTLRENTSTTQNTSTTESGRERKHVNYDFEIFKK
jgi:hypothetical protein